MGLQGTVEVLVRSEPFEKLLLERARPIVARDATVLMAWGLFKKLVIAEAIKTIGIHTVDVKLGQGVTAQVKVVVAPLAK